MKQGDNRNEDEITINVNEEKENRRQEEEEGTEGNQVNVLYHPCACNIKKLSPHK
jgi:hypothetical protein